MQVTLAALAEAANTTEDGSLNILGIFNEVRAASFPAHHPSCVLVITLRVRPSETGRPITLTLKLMDDDRVLTEVEGEITVPEQADLRRDVTVNQLFKLQMLPLERAGSYAFHVLLNGDEKATVPFQAVEQQLEA